MPESKTSKAVKLSYDSMKVEIIEFVDSTSEAEVRTQRVQDLVAKMIVLGKKKGRPKKEETQYEEAA